MHPSIKSLLALVSQCANGWASQPRHVADKPHDKHDYLGKLGFLLPSLKLHQPTTSLRSQHALAMTAASLNGVCKQARTHHTG